MNFICKKLANQRGHFRLIPTAFLSLFAILIFSSISLNAKTTTSTGDGNWNNAGTWDNGIPVAGDTVIIGSRDDVTIPAGYSAQCATITFGDDRTSSITLAAATSSLTVSGTVTIRNPRNNQMLAINVGAGTFSAGALTLQGAAANRLSQLNVSTGTATISGNITTAGAGSQIIFSGAGTLNVGGDFMAGTPGTFTASTSTVVFYGAGSSTIFGSHTFNNLSCTTASKSILVTQVTTQTVGGAFTIDGGAVDTRVSLASTGGAGTTWNLVLNGSRTCQYVAVQGSNASGTVLFPINPTGSLNNGDNTNWFPPQSVTYNGNGNTGGTVPVDGSSPYAEGATVTVLNQGTLTKTGAVFSNWNTAADGSGIAYNPTDTFQMPTTPVILYAQWASVLTISGTVYTDEAKTTPIAAGTSVAVSINGAAPQNITTNASGQFSVSGTASPNDVILAYLDAVGGMSSYHALFTSATGTNITKGNGTADLALTNLLDNSDGSDSGYDIDINWSAGGNILTNGDTDATAGDAYNLFNGKVNLGTEFAYQANGDVIITFRSLDTDKLYTVAIYSSAPGYGGYSNSFQLGGATSATQASSTGTTVVDNLTVQYDWDNNADGYVAKWIDIDPNGTDFTVTITSATNDFLIGPTAIMLQEQPPAGSSGSLVTISDGSTDLTGANELELVTDKIILEHQSGSAITNTHLDVIDTVDGSDADGITVSGGDVTFASSREVWISSGDTYNPGGNVTLKDIEIFGTFEGGANTINVNGSWNNNGGAFTPGTSSVVFASASDANIGGSTNFNNLRCVVPGKKFIFDQGSTTTLSGMLHLQGDRATTTRIILESSGGPGTTWNLVLNGNHDCNYVNPQGSSVSGTCYLPINPAGYFDGGDNTNWYDTALPEDVVFYDNFENSTLGSASPDRESSYWTDDAAWITTPAETVNTYNNTTGGSQSMYAEPAAPGDGDASWNNPEWGPVDNGVAECWFYDDMNDGGGKRVWASVESSDGMEWAAIGISTVDSATKYCFHQGSGGAPMATLTTFIDRSVGWHKATWIRDVNFITLYLDDIQIYQGPNTQLDNFADFDLGSWDYDNPNGTTGMWFDDCIVYRSQHQSKYRWYENDDAQNPTPIDAEDTAITREINQPVRVRIQLQNDMAMDWGSNPAYVGLQYRQGTVGSWVDIGTGAHWEYFDGLGTDGAQISNALLTNTNIRNHFVESQPSSQILTASPSEYPEWDFSIQANSNASIGSFYYFRMIVTDSSGNYLKPLAAYPYLPECQIVSLSMWVWTGAVSNDWNDPANWNQATIPDATSDVIIQTGAARNPRVNISGALAKSLVVQTGMTLLLDTASTDLTVSNNMTVNGTVIHSSNSAVLNLNAGELRIDAGTYNHSGNGTLNASGADMRILNNGSYNFTGQGQIDLKDLYIDNLGAFNDTTAAGTMNVQNFNILGNGQFNSNQTGSVYNINGDFVNNGSMLGTTGGIFNFTGTDKTYSGSATNHIFYQANFNGSYSVTTTSDIKFLDDVTIGAVGSLTANTGTLYVGGDWTNSNSFIHGSGTVNLNGTALQQITSGGSDWYNLTQTNASGAGVTYLDSFTTSNLTNATGNSTMTFNAGSTYNITGASGLTLTGTAGNLVTLASSSPGTKWFINPSGGSWSVNYLSVTDSVNIYDDAIFPGNTVNNGTTINWFSEDSDGDEIPDYFEFVNYGGLVNGAGSDTDGDGLTLLQEFILNTDPTVTNNNNTIYVDDNAGYIGDGSAIAPYKYLVDALDNANDGDLISLAEGTYELDDYAVTKRVIIKGANGPYKTIIRDKGPDGSSAMAGQMLSIATKNFGLQDVTLIQFRDDKPIISYQSDTNIKIVSISNVIFKDNNTQSKSLIAPSNSNVPKRMYIFNCLFHDNIGESAFELSSTKKGKALNNTIIGNTFSSAAIIVSGNKDSWLTNNILRTSAANEILDNSSGTLTVSYCNIEGGFAGASNSYDTAETFADSANGYYRLLSGSAGENAGTVTAFDWDMDNVARPLGAAFDVGCFETDPNDQDGDGISDADELSPPVTVPITPITDPTNPDSDGDGITDGEEINVWGTNPMNTNTDGDFIDDGDELAMGMDPAVYDGVGDIQGVYKTSFEATETLPAPGFPLGDLADTIWGPVGNTDNSIVIKGDMKIADAASEGITAYDGVRVGKAKGNPGGGIVESSFVGWVDRNSLDNYWMSISYKAPRAKLPTDLNEAFNLAGCFFAIDENGYLNVWDPNNKKWQKDTQVIPDDWVRITIHRDHPGQTVDLWVETRQAFAGMPVSGPHPTAGTGKFRISFSSVGEQDAFFDLFSALPFAPF